MAEFVRHEACPNCGSKDNLAIYSDGSFFCFSHCGHKSLSQDYKEELDSKDEGKYKRYGKRDNQERDSMDKEIPKSTKPTITEEEKEEIKGSTSTKGLKFRGIRDDISIPFGVRYGYNSDGEVIEQFYPVTQEGQLVGYKIREVPKNFRSIGRTGADCECFMQFKFNRPAKYVLICEGELCSLSAYQMLNDYNKSRGSDFETAVVSPTTGAMSKKQIANNYKFFDQFENIILCMDNDEPGKKAEEELLKHLPKGEVKVMRMRFKDPNEYLMKGKEREFVQDFYAAETHVPVGVVPSNKISDAMREELVVSKIPLPPFMHKLQDMMAGGIPLGRIVNLGSASGTGKSTIIDEVIYYLIFNSPHKCGIVTLESTVGQYGIKLLSRHISQKIELLDGKDAISLLDSDKIKEKEHDLFNMPDGSPRFYLVDDRNGEVDDIQGAIENLIIGCGCKVVVLDPVSDVISRLPLDEQENFMSWQKGMIKSHGCTFLNVTHTRKTGSGQKAGSTGADLHEEDMMGSSSLYKSAACNLMFSRDKEAEDDVVRNTTVMKATKIRWTGKTGIAGRYYYDINTHTLHDLDDWLEANGG